MNELIILVGLIGALFVSLGIGISGIKKEKFVERLGGILAFAGAVCFLLAIFLKLFNT